jgi:hypothetical protein
VTLPSNECCALLGCGFAALVRSAVPGQLLLYVRMHNACSSEPGLRISFAITHET